MSDEILQDTDIDEENMNLSDKEDVMKDFNFEDILEKGSNVEDVLYDDSEDGDNVGSFSMDDQNITSDTNNDFNEAFSNEQPSVDDIAEQTPMENDVLSEDINPSFDEQSAEDSYNIEENSSADLRGNYDEPFDVSIDDTIKDMGDGTSIRENNNIAFLRSYDGSKNDKMYQIDKNFTSDGFTGNPEMDTIHVNVGYDTYGWNVDFANGLSMSLRDVKEYQIRNNALPFGSGNISYGQEVLSFKNVKRIVVYESVKYFAYGA